MVTPGTPGKIITAVPKLAAGTAQQGVTQVRSCLTPDLVAMEKKKWKHELISQL